MATFLINLPPQDMQRRLSDALGVYVDAMRYPRGTENQRAAMWLEHTRRRGWQAVAAVEVDAPAGATPASAELSDAPLL
ncbi:MAG: GNAT family N-acetyltransferase, partial [Mycobacterium sp.]